MDYTVEIYKLDRRRKDGMYLVKKVDYTDTELDAVEKIYPVQKGWIRFIKETWVERRNLMTGLYYKERYDTPIYCSPSSETYWSS